jgi:NAD(P)-dependent dehydrogenase (short-subunit alcohol dehydrogenase family)
VDQPVNEQQGTAGGQIRFDGRVVVITGAGRGLGLDHARQFADRGARVVLNDNGGTADGYGPGDPTIAEAAATAIRATGGIAVADTNDVADEAGAKALIHRALDEFGGIDVLVNNAGIGCITPGGIEGTTLDTFRHYMRINLESAFLTTREAWPHLAASERGRVILSTSTAGYFGFPGQLSYNSSKLGMVGLWRSKELHRASGSTASHRRPIPA